MAGKVFFHKHRIHLISVLLKKFKDIGIRAIFEGQARFSQLQYLYKAGGGKQNLDDFAKIGMLQGIYAEAFYLFLEILNEPAPQKLDAPLIGLFLLVCDIAINPTDGFPFDIVQYESFIFLNDPGYRFCILCQMIRDQHSDLKSAIRNYSIGSSMLVV